MKKNILSLIMGATLVLPTMAMAMPTSHGDMMPPSMPSVSAKSTAQADMQSPNAKPMAHQTNAVEIDESDDMQMDDESGDMDEDTSDMNYESGDMENAPRDMNKQASPMNNNTAAMTRTATTNTATTARASAPNTQAPNMQHSNADYQPLITGEAAAENKMANTASTLQEKTKDKRGELLATQPANVQFKENRRIAVSR
ncbi:hypothetical protein [Psychrobacter sp. NG27]|uniref:hypothetical protein n=1 Tax=Psychrobacter sp. NG27 TaxID=2781966 RepID=UPI0018E04AD9|nr:hypothetical protein [Psychrobacter sp. NG27]MBI0425863.1 hypothetical protein [Psychrobacter sp. NG27]